MHNDTVCCMNLGDQAHGFRQILETKAHSILASYMIILMVAKETTINVIKINNYRDDTIWYECMA